MKIHITPKMTGKMEGFISINTSPADNPFCLAMSKIPGTICEKCYSLVAMKRYKNADKVFRRNGKALSESILPDEAIPYINAHTVRFNSHGELINKTHFKNLCKIAEKNPRTHFVLWTKRINLLTKQWPDNLEIIQSSIYINKPGRKAKKAKKLFTVYNNDTKTNCNLKCKDCFKCYDKNDNTTYIKERLK